MVIIYVGNGNYYPKPCTSNSNALDTNNSNSSSNKLTTSNSTSNSNS